MLILSFMLQKRLMKIFLISYFNTVILILQMILFLIGQNTKRLKNFFHLHTYKKIFKRILQPLNLREKKNRKKRITSFGFAFFTRKNIPHEQSIETIDLKNIYNFEKKISNNLRKKILLRSTREFSRLKEGNGMQINILIILKKTD